MEKLEQVDEIVEMGDKAKLHVVVNNEFRYMKIHSRSKEFIGKPEFGELRYLHAWQTFTPNAHTEPDGGEILRRGFALNLAIMSLISYGFSLEKHPQKYLLTCLNQLLI